MVKNMVKSNEGTINDAWEEFSKTGAIGAYLMYTAMKSKDEP